MIEQFKKLLQKKAEEQAGNPPNAKNMEAKASVMKELSDMLKGKMKGDMVDGLKKVTVASNSPEGLKTGLELAKDKMEELSPDLESEDMEEESESPEEKLAEEKNPDMEIAELEKKIAELKAKKA
jgi:hypothetical protein